VEILAFEMNALLAKGVQILYAAIGLGLVIFFHELGHFAVAKWCNVFVERFSIGFGPILWSFKKGETEYALSAIPFGGYVKMLGQDDMDPSQLTAEEIALDPRSYSAKNVPQRMAIISAVCCSSVPHFIWEWRRLPRKSVRSSPGSRPGSKACDPVTNSPASTVARRMNFRTCFAARRSRRERSGSRASIRTAKHSASSLSRTSPGCGG